MIGTANAGLRQIVVIVEFFPSFSSSRSGPSNPSNNDRWSDAGQVTFLFLLIILLLI
jgi:hypothetical protein